MAEEKQNNGNGGETVVKRSPKNPFVKFDGRQAKEIVIDSKSEFASITLYKEIKFVYQLNVDNNIDVSALKANYLKNINKIFKLLKIDDIKIYENNNEPVIGKNAIAFVAFIPYNLSMELILKKLYETVKFLNTSDDVIYKIRNNNKNIGLISIYKNIQANDDIFIKGFVAISHENQNEYQDERNFLRAGTFLRDNLGFNNKDIVPFNYRMIFNKISLYNNDDKKVFTYTIPFKRSFKVIFYQLEGSSESKKFSMIRNDVVVTLQLKDVESDDGRTKKISAGAFVNNNQTIKEINTFSEIFEGEDKWLLDDIKFDINSIEANNFRDEIKSIDEVLIDSIDVQIDETSEEEPADEIPPEVVETPEEKKPATDKPKKDKKTKKKASSEATEIVPPTTNSEVKTEEVEVFNDIGSLADDEDKTEVTEIFDDVSSLVDDKETVAKEE